MTTGPSPLSGLTEPGRIYPASKSPPPTVPGAMREDGTWLGEVRLPTTAEALLLEGEHKSDAALNPVELATWTLMANQLLNLDEVLNK